MLSQLIEAFSGHCETSRWFVDSSTEHSPSPAPSSWYLYQLSGWSAAVLPARVQRPPTPHHPPSAWAWPRVARSREVPTHVTHFLFTEEDAEEERCCKYPSTVIWAITIDKVVRMICTRCIGSDHIMEIIHSSSSIFGYNLVYLIYECLLLCCIHECILVLNIASCSRIRGFNM